MRTRNIKQFDAAAVPIRLELDGWSFVGNRLIMNVIGLGARTDVLRVPVGYIGSVNRDVRQPMNHHLSIMFAIIISTVVGGCGESATQDGQLQLPESEPALDNATMRAGLDPTDDRIVALVSWLRREGVTLESKGSGWWRLTQPKTPDDYDVVFSIRSFPTWASEQQMREALDINLAYILNTPAHLAMSYGSVKAATPDAHPKSDDELPKLNDLPVTHAIQRLFKKYKAG